MQVVCVMCSSMSTQLGSDRKCGLRMGTHVQAAMVDNVRGVMRSSGFVAMTCLTCNEVL